MPLFKTPILSISDSATVDSGPSLVLVNSHGISFGLNSSTITANASSTSFNAGVKNIGVVGQTASTGTIVFANSNTITFGMAGSSQITASHGALTAGIQSISAGTTRITTGEVVLSNSNSVSFGANGQTITASYNLASNSMWPPIEHCLGTWSVSSGTTGATGGSSQTTAHYRIGPAIFPNDVVFNEIAASASFQNPAAGTFTQTLAILLGIYSLNQGTRFDAVSTFAFNYNMSQSSNTKISFNIFWGSNSTSNNTQTGYANFTQSSNLTGIHRLRMYGGAATTIPKGQYWIAAAVTSANNPSGGLGLAGTVGQSYTNITTYQYLDTVGAGTASSNSTSNPLYPPYLYLGVFTTASNNTFANDYPIPATIHTSAITGSTTSQWLMPYVKFLMT